MPKVLLIENMNNNEEIGKYLEKYNYILDTQNSYHFNEFYILKSIDELQIKKSGIPNLKKINFI